MKTCDRRVVALLALAATLGPAPDSAGGEWAAAGPGYAWSFPRDHWAHRDYRVEWWYFTGHLETVGGSPGRFGFQFTVFRIGLSPEPAQLDSAWNASSLLMAHASITDKESGVHRFSEVLYRESDLLAGFGQPSDPLVAWSRAPAGTDDRWELRWNGAAFDFSMQDTRAGTSFALSTRPTKPPVLHGAGGLSRKAHRPDAASLYYSFTRLETQGSLTLDGRTHRVRGQAWMDHEFSTSHLAPDQVGWDWFSLQLADGREIMLYLLRRSDDRIDYAAGTLVRQDGAVESLSSGDWSVRVEASWTSPRTGAVYPAAWTIEVARIGVTLNVLPAVTAQENVARRAGLHYWEGAVDLYDAGGRAVGSGYVELTGYGRGNRPPI